MSTTAVERTPAGAPSEAEPSYLTAENTVMC